MVGNADGFQNFLSRPPEADKKIGYSDLQKTLWHGTGEAAGAHGYGIIDPPLFGPLPFGQALETLNNLNEMLGNLKNGSTAALEALKQQFSVANKEVKVVLSDDWIRRQAEKAGIDPNEFNVKDLKFGVMNIASTEQYTRLEADVNRLREQYGGLFGHVEAQLITDAHGNRRAVVLGLDKEGVDLFNSVRLAEAKQRDLAQTVQKALNPGKDQDKSLEPKKEASIMNIGSKVAELEAMYPKKPPQADAVTSEIAGPAPVYRPGKKPGVMEVA